MKAVLKAEGARGDVKDGSSQPQQEFLEVRGDDGVRHHYHHYRVQSAPLSLDEIRRDTLR